MYNGGMPPGRYEIRECGACGLRYPRPEGGPGANGARCPACLGETRVAVRVDGGPPAESALERPSRGASLKRSGELAVLLDNVRSAWNVGSILRSADGIGFAHAYLCGITPPGDNEAVRKTALGAEGFVPWSYHKNALELVRELRREDAYIIALEDHPRAVELGGQESAVGRTVLILGNELTGVDPGVLDLCDAIIHIPMHGEKQSFNVAIAFGIAAYALRQ